MTNRIISTPSPGDLKALRERLGLTQIEMAERLHASRCSIIRWEQGIQRMSRPVAAHFRSLASRAVKALDAQ